MRVRFNRTFKPKLTNRTIFDSPPTGCETTRKTSATGNGQRPDTFGPSSPERSRTRVQRRPRSQNIIHQNHVPPRDPSTAARAPRIPRIPKTERRAKVPQPLASPEPCLAARFTHPLQNIADFYPRPPPELRRYKPCLVKTSLPQPCPMQRHRHQHLNGRVPHPQVRQPLLHPIRKQPAQMHPPLVLERVHHLPHYTARPHWRHRALKRRRQPQTFRTRPAKSAPFDGSSKAARATNTQCTSRPLHPNRTINAQKTTRFTHLSTSYTDARKQRVDKIPQGLRDPDAEPVVTHRKRIRTRCQHSSRRGASLFTLKPLQRSRIGAVFRILAVFSFLHFATLIYEAGRS